MNIPVSEQRITVRQLHAADEAFFVGTAVEIAPIGKFNGKRIGTGVIGPVTKKLREAYHDAIHGRVPRYHSWLTPIKP